MITKEWVRSLFGNWSFLIFANLKKNGPYGILVAWNDFTAEEEEVEERKSIEIYIKRICLSQEPTSHHTHTHTHTQPI